LLADALGGAITCHAALGQVPVVKQRLLQIKKVLPDLPSKERQVWKTWVDGALEALRGITWPGEQQSAEGS
jgi:hypothetical protein